ncbi:MAG: sensor histidine kinase [Kangiellaceae bacterium]
MTINNKQKSVLIAKPANGKLIHFPWISLVFVVFVISIFSSQLELNFPFKQSIEYLIYHPSHLKGLLICLTLVFILDILIFLRKEKQLRKKLFDLHEQLEQSWKQKNKQQLRANIYSDHTSKLKSFISDKLIEYMDFDEKFIHFKGIASEVRHNGIISYDKINSALNRAIEQQRFLSVYEQEHEIASSDHKEDVSEQRIGHTQNSLYDYQSAKDSLTYLWDLLDLSTAENMSLYIGKKLVEYEENYFQTQLNVGEHEDTSQTIGYHPTFYPLQALLISMQLLTDSDEIKHFLINSKINALLYKETFDFNDDQFRISAKATNELLGNPNHIVLLLENLIKNAQFFRKKVAYKQKSDRIIINIDSVNADEHTMEDGVTFSIYNRGTIIEEEDLEQIFKLGYTTRKNKDAHGKGLGLHFVKEIVNGYQGTIEANNLFNQDLSFKLLLGLASGEDFIYTIQCQLRDGYMVSAILNSESEENNSTETEQKIDYLNELKIERDIPIERIQLINTKTEDIFSLDEIANLKKIRRWTDIHSNIPLWEISLSPYKKTQIFTFNALDISGVRFVVNIPSVIE